LASRTSPRACGSPWRSVLAAVLLPLHRSAYHIDPGELGPAVVMLVEEILIGGVLGLTARLTVSALEVAGSVIAQQLGLGFVTAVDPTQGEQGMIVGNFLTMLGVTLLFATDMHHLVIAACSTTAIPSLSRVSCRPSATSRH
jgi:flagellar biosynthesis protein FliR